MLQKILISTPLALVALVSLVLLAAQWGAFTGSPRAPLGANKGVLAPPSLTPNSVSSQADRYPDHPQRDDARIAAFQAQPQETGEQAMQRLVHLLQQQDHITVITVQPDYVYAQARTRWMQYVDDLEFVWNPQAQHIDLRSASRLGRKDFGMNRSRLEALRQRWMHWDEKDHPQKQ